MPRILIADDDPISLRYLEAALTRMGCDVIAVADGASALAQAQARPFDLLLLDRRMPDIGGVELLAALRQHGVAAVAIATSAQVDAAIISQLRGAGFASVIAKPATLAELELGLSPHLHFCATARSAIDAAPPTRILDDEDALAALGGDADALHALRTLLAQELSTLHAQLETTGPNTACAALHERLHRLRASCGFCGAAALAEAAARLDRNMRDDPGNGQAGLADFLDACRQTQAALSQASAVPDDARTSPSIPHARRPAPSR